MGPAGLGRAEYAALRPRPCYVSLFDKMLSRAGLSRY
jgi:hypothetical protein